MNPRLDMIEGRRCNGEPHPLPSWKKGGAGSQTMSRLDEKVAVITGGGTGIGKAIARAFASEGAKLVIASRNRRNLESTAAELVEAGAAVIVVPTDVTDEGEVAALFEVTMNEHGRVDILVNNAAAFDGGPIDELPLSAWQNVIGVNLTGVFLCTREAMRIMMSQGGGRIMNIGSVAAQVPRPNTAAYTTSKHGLVGLTKATALEGRDSGVVASCLHPGNVRTEIWDSMDTPASQEPRMSTADVAQTVLTMATLPTNVNMIESVMLPVEQPYLARG